MSGPIKQTLDEDFWDSRYLEGNTGWDIGYASTPLKTYFDGLPDKNISILIPGCGNSYEAHFLVEKGFTNITLIDISGSLVSKLKEEFRNNQQAVKILKEDFFAHQGKYDLIIEQTFFCAIHPSQRAGYVKKMHSLLLPGGKLAGVLFNREFEHDGPTFGGSIEKYRKLFSAHFPKLKIEPCYNSIPQRAGSEVFVVAERLDKMLNSKNVV